MSRFAKSMTKAKTRSQQIASQHERVFSGAGEFGFLNQLNQQELMSQHEEQLRHNVGYAGAIIRVIANTIAGQRFHVGRVKKGHEEKYYRTKQILSLMPKSMTHFSDDVELLTEHTLLDSINKPNPLMGKFALIANTFTCLETCGVMYWWFRRVKDNPDSEITQIGRASCRERG